MTDGKLVKVMARICRLNEQMKGLMDNDLLDHPGGRALREELQDNGLGYSLDCTLITYDHLIRPERWEYTRHGPLKRKATKPE